MFRMIGCAAVLVFAAGCSGINASKSISPLDFFLPGLLKTEPQPASPAVPLTNSVATVAQAR
jgi:hypothetical protein